MKLTFKMGILSFHPLLVVLKTSESNLDFFTTYKWEDGYAVQTFGGSLEDIAHGIQNY